MDPRDKFVRRSLQGLRPWIVQLESTSHLVIVIEPGSGLELARGRAPDTVAARELAYFICRGVLVPRTRWVTVEDPASTPS